MKRFRGQKRYYRNLARSAAEFSVDPEWYHFDHTHVDWQGHGNISAKHRRSHFRAMLQMLENATRQLDSFGKPYQCFLMICPDAGDDALYIHTPNPHSAFPFRLDDADWDVPAPFFLQGLVDTERFRVGSVHNEYGRFCYIVPWGKGTPLWN